MQSSYANEYSLDIPTVKSKRVNSTLKMDDLNYRNQMQSELNENLIKRGRALKNRVTFDKNTTTRRLKRGVLCEAGSSSIGNII